MVCRGQLLSWAVLGTAILTAVSMATNILVPVATTLLGGALGAMATILLVSSCDFYRFSVNTITVATGCHTPYLPGGCGLCANWRDRRLSDWSSVCHTHYKKWAEFHRPHPVIPH